MILLDMKVCLWIGDYIRKQLPEWGSCQRKGKTKCTMAIKEMLEFLLKPLLL